MIIFYYFNVFSNPQYLFGFYYAACNRDSTKQDIKQDISLFPSLIRAVLSQSQAGMMCHGNRNWNSQSWFLCHPQCVSPNLFQGGSPTPDICIPISTVGESTKERNDLFYFSLRNFPKKIAHNTSAKFHLPVFFIWSHNNFKQTWKIILGINESS